MVIMLYVHPSILSTTPKINEIKFSKRPLLVFLEAYFESVNTLPRNLDNNVRLSMEPQWVILSHLPSRDK